MIPFVVGIFVGSIATVLALTLAMIVGDTLWTR
jgi:hypothetical protein